MQKTQVTLRPLLTDSMSLELGAILTTLTTMGVDDAICEEGHCCHDRSQMRSEMLLDWTTKAQAREGLPHILPGTTSFLLSDGQMLLGPWPQFPVSL